MIYAGVHEEKYKVCIKLRKLILIFFQENLFVGWSYTCKIGRMVKGEALEPDCLGSNLGVLLGTHCLSSLYTEENNGAYFIELLDECNTMKTVLAISPCRLSS